MLFWNRLLLELLAICLVKANLDNEDVCAQNEYGANGYILDKVLKIQSPSAKVTVWDLEDEIQLENRESGKLSFVLTQNYSLKFESDADSALKITIPLQQVAEPYNNVAVNYIVEDRCRSEQQARAGILKFNVSRSNFYHQKELALRYRVNCGPVQQAPQILTASFKKDEKCTSTDPIANYLLSSQAFTLHGTHDLSNIPSGSKGTLVFLLNSYGDATLNVQSDTANLIIQNRSIPVNVGGYFFIIAEFEAVALGKSNILISAEKAESREAGSHIVPAEVVAGFFDWWNASKYAQNLTLSVKTVRISQIFLRDPIANRAVGFDASNGGPIFEIERNSTDFSELILVLKKGEVPQFSSLIKSEETGIELRDVPTELDGHIITIPFEGIRNILAEEYLRIAIFPGCLLRAIDLIIRTNQSGVQDGNLQNLKSSPFRSILKVSRRGQNILDFYNVDEPMEFDEEEYGLLIFTAKGNETWQIEKNPNACPKFSLNTPTFTGPQSNSTKYEIIKTAEDKFDLLTFTVKGNDPFLKVERLVTSPEISLSSWNSNGPQFQYSFHAQEPCFRPNQTLPDSYGGYFNVSISQPGTATREIISVNYQIEAKAHNTSDDVVTTSLMPSSLTSGYLETKTTSIYEVTQTSEFPETHITKMPGQPAPSTTPLVPRFSGINDVKKLEAEIEYAIFADFNNMTYHNSASLIHVLSYAIYENGAISAKDARNKRRNVFYSEVDVFAKKFGLAFIIIGPNGASLKLNARFAGSAHNLNITNSEISSHLKYLPLEGVKLNHNQKLDIKLESDIGPKLARYRILCSTGDKVDFRKVEKAIRKVVDLDFKDIPSWDIAYIRHVISYAIYDQETVILNPGKFKNEYISHVDVDVFAERYGLAIVLIGPKGAELMLNLNSFGALHKLNIQNSGISDHLRFISLADSQLRGNVALEVVLESSLGPRKRVYEIHLKPAKKSFLNTPQLL